MIPNPVRNGKIPPPVLPFVTVISDPSKASAQNPNGVMISTNMRDPSGKPPQIVMIQILSEAIHLLARGMESAAPVSANIVLPDGSAAPLPVQEEVAKG